MSVVVGNSVAAVVCSYYLVGLFLAVLNSLVAQLWAHNWIHRQIRNFPSKIRRKKITRNK